MKPLVLKQAKSGGSDGGKRKNCRVFQVQVMLALNRERSPENDIARLPIFSKTP